MEWVEDFSDYITTFSVRRYGGDHVCSSNHVHVRFCHNTIQPGIAEIAEETRNICLRNNVLESENHEIILSEGLRYWPIDADTVLAIAEEVIEKARNLRWRNLLVDIYSSRQETTYEDDQDSEVSDIQETYEDDDDDGNQDFVEPYDDGDLAVKSLKRKRIEYTEGDGFRCVICLEDLTAGSDVAVMPCNHYSFHGDCLSSWLERSRSCPLCRRNFASGQ